MTSDQMSGGSSTASLAVRNGALVVTGEIAPGFAFPWGGVIWPPGEQPHAVLGLSRPGGDSLPDAGGWKGSTR